MSGNQALKGVASSTLVRRRGESGSKVGDKACSFKMGLQKSFWVTGFWPLNDSTVSHLQSKHHERKHHERVVLQSKHHERKHHERVVVLQSKHHEKRHHKRVGVCRLCEPRKKDIMDSK